MALTTSLSSTRACVDLSSTNPLRVYGSKYSLQNVPFKSSKKDFVQLYYCLCSTAIHENGMNQAQIYLCWESECDEGFEG